MRHAPLLLLALVALCPVAAAQDTWFYQGGEPGVRASIDGAPLEDASSPATSIRVDPDAPVGLSISIAPPPGTTWTVRAIRVGLLVSGPGTEPPEALVRTASANSTLPPGYTVVVNRSIELSSLKRVGAGTFLMAAEVQDDDAASLYLREFYVRIPAGFGTLLTAQGATLTAISVATGYGLWAIGRDIKELRDAWARHRKRKEAAKLDVLGRTESLAEELVAKTGRPAASVVGLHRAAQETERTLGPVRWAATGLGLGGVLLAWGQFLGFVAFDLTRLLVSAMEMCAAFLTIALVANALLRRARAAHAPAPAERTVTLIPEDVQADRSAVVQPADKRD